MKKYLIIVACAVLLSCKTSLLLKKIPDKLPPKTIGVVVQLNQMKDTTQITSVLIESLQQCGYTTMTDLFDSKIYLQENLDLLYAGDSTLLSSMPTILNLPILLVGKLEFKTKVNETTGRKQTWATLLMQWMELWPFKKIHQFYYVERIDTKGLPEEQSQLQEYMESHVRIATCYDIGRYINKH